MSPDRSALAILQRIQRDSDGLTGAAYVTKVRELIADEVAFCEADTRAAARRTKRAAEFAPQLQQINDAMAAAETIRLIARWLETQAREILHTTGPMKHVESEVLNRVAVTLHGVAGTLEPLQR